MGVNYFPFGIKSYGYHTESAGTAIEENIPGGSGRACILYLAYTGDGTAHTLSVLYADGAGSRNTADGEQESGQKDIVCVDDPKDPAGNAAAADDIVAYQKKNGEWAFSTVDSVASKTITLDDDIEAPGIASGGKINVIGAQGDGAEFQLLAAASDQKEFGGDWPVVACPYDGEPMVFHSPNGTNAGQLDNMLVGYLNK